MKKSELRNIIRESIKELINEQTYPGNNCVLTVSNPPWASQHCQGVCDNGFSAMCCQNTNNQPYTASSSPSNWASLIGIEGQTIPCVTTCTPMGVFSGYDITANDIAAVAIQYGQVTSNFGGVISPSSPYPTTTPFFGIWDISQGSTQACNSFMSSPPPPNVEPQSADIPNLQVADPIPPVPLKKADPTIDRMKDLAFKGKRK